MNLHVPQSLETSNEIEEIAAVPTQIISPAKCVPIITIVQDSLVGAYLLTQDDVRIYAEQADNLMMNIKDFTGNLPEPSGVDELGIKYWNGRDIYSTVLPEISLKSNNNSNQFVEIENGTFISGSLDSSNLGTKGLIHETLNIYDKERCVRFIDSTQNLVTRWLSNRGFSVGLGDAVPVNKEMSTRIEEILDSKLEEINNIMVMADQGLYEQNLDDILRRKSLDLEILAIQEKGINEVLKYIKNILPKTNSFNNMITSGSKGKQLNLQQIMGTVGQQQIWGSRVADGFTNRTLPHFHKYAFGPIPKGFVKNSYIKGMDPAGFFFHMMGGRVGLIDTAVKSVTGDTPIIITENGKTKRVLIGDWIDNILDNNAEKVEHYEERDMELLKTKDSQLYIPTTDEKGNVSWGEITAITRHDPGKELYKIKTLGGRDVIVTESKSLLIWNAEKEIYERKSTPEVKIGDYVPVTLNLPEHHEITNYINVADYLEKKEYIYGTDFKIAYDLVFNKYNKKVPQGWWKQENGKTFTLPYEFTHRLLRVSKRSNIENIKEGYVFPYNGKRINTLIPEKFELNRDNGFFIGLYLAEGESCVKSGHVGISNNNPIINDIVVKWFDKFSINHSFATKINKIGGRSTTIRGFSTILASFFIKLVGNGARNKHIPIEAYTAPKDFVIGILDGYFSGDGTVGKNSVEASSASKELIEGITMLCSRLGIFCKNSISILNKNNVGTINIAPINRISIRAQWATKFAKIIGSSHPDKMRKLNSLYCPTSHRNFSSQNDTILDKIVSIEIIDIKEYPKVYDLTVPSTLNFGLANGLHVVDTSESGYISRRLMKALEDIKIMYDGTVRNSNNNIIQFIYGDDNYDPIKLEKVKVDLIEQNNLQMEDKYKFNFQSEKDWESIITKTIVKELLDIKDYQKILDDEYNILMEYRHNLRYDWYKYTDVIEVVTYMPFNLFKLIPTVKYKFNIGNYNISNINPVYIVTTVNELCDFVTKYINDKNSLQLTKLYIRSFLSSKLIIMKYKFNKDAFDYIINILKEKILSSFVQPGEMVGPIAAQSLGEISTQLTLNTFHASGAGAGSVVVTEGVPRMKEIINISRAIKTPSMKVYLKEEYSQDRKKAEELKNNIEYTQLRDIVTKTEIIYESSKNINTDMSEDFEFIKIYNEFNDIVCVDEHEELSNWILRIIFNKEVMMTRNILMVDVQSAILQHSQSEDDIQCLISDDNGSELIMRIKVRSESEDEYFLSFFKDLEKRILEMTLRGIRGIKNVDLKESNIIKYKPDGSYVTIKEWYIETDGSNLGDTLLLDYVDIYRTETNDIVENYELFGIECVRVRIIEELEKVFATSDINQRHIAVLADYMTYRGIITQIDRHGINRSPDNSVIAKASFEEVGDMFVKAATFNEIDKMNGVSANIMFGQVAPCGTNSFDVLFDENKLMEFANDDDDEQFEFDDEEIDEVTVNEKITDIYQDMDENLQITDEDFEFGFSLENLQEHNIGPMKVVERETPVKVIDTKTPDTTGPKKTIKIKKKK